MKPTKRPRPKAGDRKPGRRAKGGTRLLDETRFRLLIEQSPFSTQVVATDGRTRHVNKAWEELWGLTLEDLEGYNLLEDSQLVEKGIMPYIRKGFAGEVSAIPAIQYDVARTLPGRAKRADARRWVKGFIYPVKDASGRIQELVLMHEDITEAKRLEEALRASEERLRALNAELELRVAQRTAELQAANRELEAFSGSVSHDLRAPLRHILSYASLLLRPGVVPELPATVEKIRRSALRMEELIRDLLAFSRGGTIELKRSRFGLGEVVEEARASLEPDAKGRRVRWAVAALPEVEGDRSLLLQVLVNLLGNALKFTSSRPEARIEVGCLPEARGQRPFFVKDDGVGFEPESAGRLFAPFMRLHGREFAGSGLGLANVRRIVERHGGRVWAKAEPGRGATFFFSLPVPPARKGES